MHKTLRLEIIEVASDVTKVFFSNVNLKISKEGNFGPKFKDSYFILVSLHKILSIFIKWKVVILMI